MDRVCRAAGETAGNGRIDTDLVPGKGDRAFGRVERERGGTVAVHENRTASTTVATIADEVAFEKRVAGKRKRRRAAAAAAADVNRPASPTPIIPPRSVPCQVGIAA